MSEKFVITVDPSTTKLPDIEVEKIAEDVFYDTDLLSVPVKIGAVARFYGFKIIKADMPDSTSGLVIVNDENIEDFETNKVIVINSGHSYRRNRFTTAHELGHFLMHQGEPLYAHRDTGKNGVEETNANNIAAALLMPLEILKKRVREIKHNFGADCTDAFIISKIADEFCVSNETAEIRLRKLKVI